MNTVKEPVPVTMDAGKVWGIAEGLDECIATMKEIIFAGLLSSDFIELLDRLEPGWDADHDPKPWRA